MENKKPVAVPSFKEEFVQWLYNRQEDVFQSLIGVNPEYLETQNNITDCYKKLREISGECEEIIRTLDKNISAADALTGFDYYRQGLVDGMDLKRFLEGEE